jgi:hypothetical protein
MLTRKGARVWIFDETESGPHTMYDWLTPQDVPPHSRRPHDWVFHGIHVPARGVPPMENIKANMSPLPLSLHSMLSYENPPQIMQQPGKTAVRA